MRRTSFSRWPCSVARTVDILGDWWTPLVLRDAFAGLARFDEFQRSLGIGRNVLTQRLNRLVEVGIMEKSLYSEHPPRFEYLLTERGRAFYPVLAAITAWGDEWLDGGHGAPVSMRHATCGKLTTPTVACSECGEPLVAAEVSNELGPGYPERWRERAMATGRFTDPARPVC